MVSAPTFSARITSAPVPLIVPPISLSPGAFSTGIDSPVTIDSSTALVPSSTTAVDRHALARAARAADRRCCTLSSGISSSRPSARMRRAVFGARLSSARIAPPVLLAGAQFQHLAEQHQHRDDGGRFVIDRDHAVHAAEDSAGNRPGAKVATRL